MIASNPEETYEEEYFNNGDSLVLKLHYRDLDFNAVTNLSVVGPSGQNVMAWNFTSPWVFGATSYAYWTNLVDASWLPGQYTFKAVFDGRTYERTFYVGTAASVPERATEAFVMTPNPTRSLVTLSGLPTHAHNDHVLVREATGRIVHNERLVSTYHTMELSKLASGIYFVEVHLGASVHTQRLVIEQ